MVEQSIYLRQAINDAIDMARKARVEYVCPEHILYTLLSQEPFNKVLERSFASATVLKERLQDYMDKMERIPKDEPYDLEGSSLLNKIMSTTFQYAESAQIKRIDVTHLISAMLDFEDCWATQLIMESISVEKAEFMVFVIEEYENVSETVSEERVEQKAWKTFANCMNEHLGEHNKLIGREDEMERTLQVLCRQDKNNPLHIGEPGVGKTALVWGLVQRLEKGDVPERLKGYKIYELDLSSLVAGAQFHGEIEKRLKSTLDSIAEEGKAIVYIDNLHNLVGAGRNGDSSMDATQVLRPYMDREDMRFIGTTTYQDYNHYLAKRRSLARRFQQIDICEPSIEEATTILEELLPNYEKYHKVKYEEGVVRYAVEMSAKHINDRCLPDKAIDLIDEAGAWRELHLATRKYKGRLQAQRIQKIDKQVINKLLARICRINAETLSAESNEKLKTLSDRIKAQIYGQDEAVKHVVSCIEMVKAGLLDDEKPLASLLFVGPTGVGKTEVARVLAKELGIELVRFDMSEYTEKHTVAKLIGSPAGYVGYEDGGLLTDAIRKNPNCVLLLDEIEKAHSDIYNILLQVMDYARLTDNRGNKADFRNVVLIMTSNAGAQYASQASIGFGQDTTAGDAMLKEVKKTFKPEFINRLSGTIVFNEMDKTMATLILNKKICQLENKLTAKSVTMTLTADAKELLLKKGFNSKYGAREMDRTIQQMLTPLLMREILYGKLQKGGHATILAKEDELYIEE